MPYIVSLYAFATDCELSAYPAPHFWLSVFWVRGIQETLTLILNENYFQFNGRKYLKIHGTAMGTKMAVAFGNIFMANIETQIVSQSVAVKPTVWKRYIDDVFQLCDTSNLHDIERFIEQANSSQHLRFQP